MFDRRWTRYNRSDGYYDKVICNFAEMEGGLSLNHLAETLFASETFVRKAAFRLYENKTLQN